jgi:hypothetical protein
MPAHLVTKGSQSEYRFQREPIYVNFIAACMFLMLCRQLVPLLPGRRTQEERRARDLYRLVAAELTRHRASPRKKRSPSLDGSPQRGRSYLTPTLAGHMLTMRRCGGGLKAKKNSVSDTAAKLACSPTRTGVLPGVLLRQPRNFRRRRDRLADFQRSGSPRCWRGCRTGAASTH